MTYDSGRDNFSHSPYDVTLTVAAAINDISNTSNFLPCFTLTALYPDFETWRGPGSNLARKFFSIWIDWVKVLHPIWYKNTDSSFWRHSSQRGKLNEIGDFRAPKF